MVAYTGTDIAARALRFGASPPLARIMGAAAMAEGGGNSEAVGDNGTSLGAFQINDIHGLTREQRFDLDFATQWMLEHEFQVAYFGGLQRGYEGERLCRWTCMAAERPYGWKGPGNPGLDSPAADGYARHWYTTEEPTEGGMVDRRREALLAQMRAYWGYPYVFGGKSPETSFDCSGLITHCARAVGLDLGDPYYTSADGLRGHCAAVSTPLVGDIVLFHTTYGSTGPSYATHCGVVSSPGTMLDTHDGVHETNYLAPYWKSHLMGFWRPAQYNDAAQEDPVKIQDLETRLGYIQGDVAHALQQALDGAQAATTDEERAAAHEALQSAINSLRNT